MLIFRSGRLGSLLGHISFSGKALRTPTMIKLLPELKLAIEYFVNKSISQWMNTMELDKKILERTAPYTRDYFHGWLQRDGLAH